MKTSELLEQIYKRRPPEVIAAEKAAPGYWRTLLRKEFNATVRKFGGTVQRPLMMGKDDNIAFLGGNIFVLADGPGTLVGRDRRARGLAHTLTRMVERLAKEGYTVGISRWNQPFSVGKVTHDTPRHTIEMEMRDAMRVEDAINHIHTTPDHHKRHIVFVLKLVLAKHPSAVE